MQIQSAFIPWWGDFSLDIGDTMHWHFGALELSLQRLRSEWQVRSRTIVGLPDDGRPVSMNPEASPLSDYSCLERCICHSSSRHFRLLPVLADRAVVTRPSTPVHLPRGEKVTLYVSSPLWIRAVVCATAEWSLEMPVIVPSDTWFGTSTYDGELCYAARTDVSVRYSPHSQLMLPLR